jgi:hypothetical protein
LVCMAAGENGLDGSAQFGRWNGRSWSGPTPSFGVSALSCVSRNVCAAVSGGCGPSAGLWTHGRWSHDLAVPCTNHSQHPRSELAAVSCSSASACTAVGTTVYGWNGQRWTLEPNALRRGESLHGVSCVSRTACIGVGARRTGNTTLALVKRWNGSRWSTVYISKLSGSQLNSVSCTSATVCRAVGSYVYTYVNDGYTATGAPREIGFSAPLVASNG